MSKLSVVRETLEKNPGVVIVHTDKKVYLPDKNGFFCHTIDYWVAPKDGLYTAKELQRFMLGLIPNLPPTSKDDFVQWKKDGELQFGKLYFDEKVGEERTITKRILVLTDEELLDANRFVGGKLIIDKDVTEDYVRRTWVRPFPNEAFAMDVLNGKLRNYEYGANQNILRRYKPSLLQKLVG